MLLLVLQEGTSMPWGSGIAHTFSPLFFLQQPSESEDRVVDNMLQVEKQEGVQWQVTKGIENPSFATLKVS